MLKKYNFFNNKVYQLKSYWLKQEWQYLQKGSTTNHLAKFQKQSTILLWLEYEKNC